MHLRCTLMGFERNYRIKIPSKQLNVSGSAARRKNFTTFNSLSHVNPWFWTGLIDGEASFSIIIDRNETRKLGWRLQSKFKMGLHKRDLSLLLQLQKNLGRIGSIYINPNINKVNYSVNSNKDLTRLIINLDKYPLLTQKGADFLLFKEAVKLMNNKAHLSIEGKNQIINIKASMNLGLSDFLKSEFNDFSPVERQVINTENIPDPNWIAGFVTNNYKFSSQTGLIFVNRLNEQRV
uniref:LAGLIDADG endonuclease n=1 Tax=Ramaria cf. rubripermanens TaxID=2016387 RepID=UPI002238522A|nr:LAGLIDADG endonuclease [Ramaria cf. rubripermanens]UYR22167.1 LAGLIDADG endonuclease [Ramaria cf. rubripermanens]